MNHIQPAADRQPDAFPQLFKTYIVRSVQAALARVKTETHILSDEVRERALHVLTYAFDLPEAWPHTRALLFAMMPKMDRVGHGADWIACLTEGAHYSTAYGDTEATAEFGWQLGYLYRQQSQFDVACRWLQTSVDCFAKVNQTRGTARALNEMAFVAWLQHHHRAAGQLAESALSLLGETDPERAMSYRVQGLIAIDHERWQEAEGLHRRALQLSEKQKDEQRIAWCLQNLGYALRGQQRFAEAIDCFERASTILESIQDSYNGAVVQMNLGIAYRLSNKPDSALVCHLRAAKIFQKIGDMLNLAKLYTNLGLDYWVLERWSQAEQAFRLSIDIYEGLGDESWRLNAVDGLAMTYLAQKLYVKAIAVLGPALTALSQIREAPNYNYLQRSLTEHLREAREGLAAAHNCCSSR